MSGRRTALGLGLGALGAAGAVIALRRASDRFTDAERGYTLSGAPFGPPEQQGPRRGPVSGTSRVLAPDWEPETLSALAKWQPRRPAHPLARAGVYLWAAPLTLMGVLLGLATGARPQVRQGVLVFSGAGGPTAAYLRARRFRGMALGHVVIARGQVDDVLMAHELLHVRQAERFGPFFAPLYLALYAAYGYTRHPMERAARLAARQHLGAPN